MRARIVSSEQYWSLRKPHDCYLPDSIPAADVERELLTIQSRFRAAVRYWGDESVDWEFPGHYQHVKVLYVYIYSELFYRPKLTEVIESSLAGFDGWVAELECYSAPGVEDDTLFMPLFRNGEFILDAEDKPLAFATTLGLEVTEG
jgi:hypothetical protein